MVTIRAIAEQAKLMTQYRQMFGCDITQPPAPIIDARTQILLTEVRARQEEMNRQAPPPALAPLTANYDTLSAAEQARIQIDRRRAQVTAQRAVIQGEIAG